MTRDVLVIGGGPAGMMAALTAAEAGARVTLCERNEKLGKKLYLTGKGRCNLTNTAEPERFFANTPQNPRFLRAAQAAFDAEALRAKIDELGVSTVEERGGRVFPTTQKASDITRALERALRKLGVTILLNSRVIAVRPTWLVQLENGNILNADALILATGGLSYPATGSTGDGYTFSAELGHTLVPTRPALVPLVSDAAWVHHLQGLSLRNVRLKARQGARVIMDELGELLFTHFGLSGPLALTLSSLADDWTKTTVEIDLKPGLTPEQVERRLLRDFAESPRKQLVNLLMSWMPIKLAEVLPIPAAKPASQINRLERLRLIETIKALPIPITGVRGYEEAVITRGGVDVREIVPSTMASRKVPGLYFAGEILDVDGLTGGFNLQIAFSTGFCAGYNALK